MRVWKNAIIFGVITWAIFFVYVSGRLNWNFSLPHANQALAETAITLCCFSMMLSGLCYFFSLFDSKIIYRKSLGVVGFVIALIHGTTTLFLLPNLFPFPQYFLDPKNILIVILGLITEIIFAIMVIVSFKSIIQKIGGVTWRRILRVGYLAILLIFFHATIPKYQYWLNYQAVDETILPPISFFTMPLILVTILLRILLEIHKEILHKNQKPGFPLSRE